MEIVIVIFNKVKGSMGLSIVEVILKVCSGWFYIVLFKSLEVCVYIIFLKDLVCLIVWIMFMYFK